jgi:molecular chaperone GrpE
MVKEQEQNNNENENKSKQDPKLDSLEESEENTNKATEGENKKELSQEEKIIELEDKLTRSFAEMENQRRRFEKEREEAFEYGGYSFAKEALSLIDNLERSKQVLEKDDSLKNSEALNKALEHLDIIYNDIISIFSKNNIKQIESLNKKLDPNLHQAMMEIEDDQKEAGTIVQEIQKGFTIKDRLLRPSLVGVSKKSQNKNEKNGDNLGDNLGDKK